MSRANVAVYSKISAVCPRVCYDTANASDQPPMISLGDGRCHRVVGGWIAAETNKWIKIRPTHWRVWPSPVKKLRHIQSSASNFPSRFALGEPLFEYGRIVMDWFSKKTSIAGIQLPNWMVVLGAIIVMLLIYKFMQQAQIPH